MLLFKLPEYAFYASPRSPSYPDVFIGHEFGKAP